MHKNSLNISTPLRILIILQLCIALSCLLWLAGYPFMGGHFTTQSELLLIESTMGIQTTHKRLDPEKAALQSEKMAQNAIRFKKLPEPVKFSTENLFSSKKETLNAPFFSKISAVFRLINEIPRLEIIWICFAVALPILLLLKNRHAAHYIWLLPLLTIAYSYNNQTKGLDPLVHSDLRLFPREDTLLLNNESTEAEIRSAWENYLATHWAKDEKTADEGEFYFNLARITESAPLSAPFWEKKSPLLLLSYIVWNLLFAWQVRKATAEPLGKTEPQRASGRTQSVAVPLDPLTRK